MQNTKLAELRMQRKMAADARAWEREKLVWDRLVTPNTVRLGLMAAIIAYSTYCARSKHNVGPVQSALAFALPGIGIPLIAADAGITDKYALAAISSAGIGYTGLSMVQGWADAGVIPSAGEAVDWFADLGSVPAASLQAMLSWLNPWD